MIRTHVIYDGIEYVIGNQGAAEVKEQIEELNAAGSGWLSANYGEGRLQKTELLIQPGIAVGLFEIDDDDPGVQR